MIGIVQHALEKQASFVEPFGIVYARACERFDEPERAHVEGAFFGLPGGEGTFNTCSFWLVEALTRAGIHNAEWLDEARLLFERMLNYANHLGLYAEQTSAQGQALGNYPQAFTHLAMISAAFNLD